MALFLCIPQYAYLLFHCMTAFSVCLNSSAYFSLRDDDGMNIFTLISLYIHNIISFGKKSQQNCYSNFFLPKLNYLSKLLYQSLSQKHVRNRAFYFISLISEGESEILFLFEIYFFYLCPLGCFFYYFGVLFIIG